MSRMVVLVNTSEAPIELRDHVMLNPRHCTKGDVSVVVPGLSELSTSATKFMQNREDGIAVFIVPYVGGKELEFPRLKPDVFANQIKILLHFDKVTGEMAMLLIHSRWNDIGRFRGFGFFGLEYHGRPGLRIDKLSVEKVVTDLNMLLGFPSMMAAKEVASRLAFDGSKDNSDGEGCSGDSARESSENDTSSPVTVFSYLANDQQVEKGKHPMEGGAYKVAVKEHQIDLA